MDSVCVVITVGPRSHSLIATVASVTGQEDVRPEVVIVAKPDSDPRLAQLLEVLSARSGARVLRPTADRPGAQRNAGARASTASIVAFVDAGDVLDPGFCWVAMNRLVQNEELDATTCWTRRTWTHGSDRWVIPDQIELRTLVLRPREAPVVVVARRRLLEMLGGFDEGLETLDRYEFWLRALQRGARVEVIEQPLLTQTSSQASEGNDGITPEAYSNAMRAVQERHRLLFEREPAALLYERERELGGVLVEHHQLVKHRDQLVAEQTALDAELRELQTVLDRDGHGAVDFGDFRRADPISRDWGYDRGKPIDRYYIERFLEIHSADIRGAVLEVQEADFTRQFGGAQVERSEVVDLSLVNPGATIVADLRRATTIPDDSFDCFILTQTIHVIDDMTAVLRESFRILKPGGVLLATLPCISRVTLEYGADGDFWRMTEAGARKLFSMVFPKDHLQVQSYGNVLVGTAFMHGLACHEIDEREFERFDPFNPLLVGVRALKPMAGVATESPRRSRPRPQSTDENGSAVVLLYHRVAEPPTDVHGLAVSPPLFRSQMEYLRQNYQVMSLDELIAAVRQGNVPARAVAVTFDDGYVDNLTHACPVLVDLDLPATFFVTTAGLDEDREYWWDTLERIFLRNASLPKTLEIVLGEEHMRLLTESSDERRAAHRVLNNALTRADLATRDQLMRQLHQWSGFSPVAGSMNRVMRGQDLLRMAAFPLFDVGAHGVNHLAMAYQPLDVQRQELADSRADLERLLSRRVTMFAYPYGNVSEETATFVRDVGFKAAVTSEPERLRPGIDFCRVPRLDVKAWGVAEFADRLARD
ncbi:MAG: polysaccharide deacetylase family protein [Vicinamibacterales bacterium]